MNSYQARVDPPTVQLSNCGSPPLRRRHRLRLEAVRQTVFDAGSLFRPYHSVNTDISKRIRYLEG